MLTLTNQKFCYWLQGYFEISKKECTLTKEKIALINGSLTRITEPLGPYTQWLSDVLQFLIQHEYSKDFVSFFLPEIKDRLNSIFMHVIDVSYDTELSLEESKKIHDGKSDDK